MNLNTCPFCNSMVETCQAMDQGKTYNALDVDCFECGMLRVASLIITLKEKDPPSVKQLRDLMQKRSTDEKKVRVWVTPEGLKKCM